LTSPWNITFWLAVIGSQTGGEHLGLLASLAVAVGVISGAAMYSGLFCSAVRMGARFATPAWNIVTQAATALLMLYFAVGTVRGLAAHA
ncbi:MAG: hypothetical protein INR65_17625, partial [Gluconacetobacter diazotrophicus]|nr:hypothetical protein [Gluconacetobacter diazotrophicus]